MRTLSLDATQIATYLACPQKWYLAHYEHLRLAASNKDPLYKGSAIHKLLEIYYKLRIDGMLTPYDAASETLTQFAATPEFLECSENNIDTSHLIQRFRDYVIRYAYDDFHAMRLDSIPSVELGFSIPFYKTDEVTYILEGKIDLIAQISPDIIFVDHKSQSRKADLYGHSVQFLTYAIATGLKKMVINYVGLTKEVNKDTFRRQLITFQDHQIERHRAKVLQVFMAIDSLLMSENKRAFESFPNPTCAGSFGAWPCQFTQLCELNPTNVEMLENLKKFQYQVSPWEPWKISEVEG